MPIIKSPCQPCSTQPLSQHNPSGPHCQYCGQGYKNGEGVGGFWYKQVEYDGHLNCIFELGGPEVELYFMKLAARMITTEQLQAQRPQ